MPDTPTKPLSDAEIHLLASIPGTGDGITSSELPVKHYERPTVAASDLGALGLVAATEDPSSHTYRWTRTRAGNVLLATLAAQADRIRSEEGAVREAAERAVENVEQAIAQHRYGLRVSPSGVAAMARNGYGVRGGSRAHRSYYEEFVGKIPPGLVLDHLCRVPACVNPEHLEPVTNAENVRRGRGTKLTESQVNEIRASDERGIDLAARYGVSPSLICLIRKGRVW